MLMSSSAVRNAVHAPIVALSLLLAACGGGNDTTVPVDDPAPPPVSDTRGTALTCDTIQGNHYVVSIPALCTTCTVKSSEGANDADLQTAASIDDGNGTVPGDGTSLRVTAQQGVVFPAGSYASAFVSFPADGSGVTLGGANFVVTLTTFLGDAAQESASTDSGSLVDDEVPRTTTNDTAPHDRLSFATTKMFDGLRVTFGAPGVRTGSTVLKVHELCSSSDIRQF